MITDIQRNPKDRIRTIRIESLFITVLFFMNHMPVNRNKKTIVKNKEAFQSALVTYVQKFSRFPRKPVFFFFLFIYFFFWMDLIGILLILKLPLKNKKKIVNKQVNPFTPDLYHMFLFFRFYFISSFFLKIASLKDFNLGCINWIRL